jgi:LytR cell envelope-related transcriptional attenuator
VSRQAGPGRSGRDGGIQPLKAILLIAAVVLIGVLVLHHNPNKVKTAGSGATTTRPTTAASTAPPTSTPPTTLVPVSSVKLQVLNGDSATLPLAGEWSSKLHATPGYDTLAGDNATSRVSASVIYVLTPGYGPEALALAEQVGLTAAAVNQTVPPPASAPIPSADRTKANLVLVIGPDLAGRA